VTTVEVARIEDLLRRAYDDAAETFGDELTPLRMRPVRRPVRMVLVLAGNAAARASRRASLLAFGWAGGGLQPQYLMAEGVVGQLQARMR
jgi:hypothetical protein